MALRHVCEQIDRLDPEHSEKTQGEMIWLTYSPEDEGGCSTDYTSCSDTGSGSVAGHADNSVVGPE
jgi:hypothetical protein